jgi:hypothetical protein
MKRFEHLGETWEAVPTGTGRGVGFGGPGGALPAINKWGVVFRSLTKPERGEYRADIAQPNPQQVGEAELRNALEEQLVLAALNRSRYIWRPAEAIARDTGLPLDRVRFILENTTEAEVISGDENSQGLLLYTTQEHLSKASGDFMKQYYRTQESS